MKKFALIGSVAALALGGAAFADHHDEDETWMDADEEGFVMMFDSRLQRAYSAIDANDDGTVSYQEWGEWQADDGFYAERFDIFDTDGDDTISWDEYRTATMSLYDTSNLTD
ncbi:MAG: hypothetical protein ABL308_08810 [Oceanicaulis sp.]